MTEGRLLAQPLQLKHHHLKNRVIMGSMHTGYEEHPQGAEHLAAFYQARAAGGVALIITGGIAPNAAGVVVDDGAKLTNQQELAWHKVIIEGLAPYDSKICMQILHTGRYAQSALAVAPSALRAPINRVTPRALSTLEIQQTVADYIACALLAQEAGYDGVEVMGSEGYLINQFLAPATNKRHDQYGGDIDNRQRFAVEIVEGIRQACGERFIIIYRISLMDLVENGSTWDETRLLAQKMTAAGVDIFNSGIGWHEARIPTIATCVPRATFAQCSAKLKAISTIPVIAANRINMPAVAEEILQANQADAVCLSRPFLADAQWVNKAIAFKDDEINTCIACNQACLDHIFAGKLVSCLVNPFACHEKQLIMEETTISKKIAVIGAGPAGLAFAINAQKRGHNITIFEQQDQIGGQLNFVQYIPGKLEFAELLRYFAVQIEQLAIELHVNKTISTADLLPFDEIVLATGIVPKKINIKGIDKKQVYSYLEVLKEGKNVGDSVAIIGAGGVGFDTAEFLSHGRLDKEYNIASFFEEWQVDNSLQAAGALRSNHPHIAKSARQIFLLQRKEGSLGKSLGKTTGWIHRLVLKNKGVTMLSGVEYDEISHDGLVIRVHGERQTLRVDNIVICAGQEPNLAILADCQQLNKPIHIIGGAKDAQYLDAKLAILSGTKKALEI